MPRETAAEFIARKRAQLEREPPRPIRMKDIGRRGHHRWVCEAMTLMPQSDLREEKVFIVERLRRVESEGKVVHDHIPTGAIWYRLGYFMRGRIGRAKGRWTWGQYCPMIPREDFGRLIELARTEGTIA